MQIPRSFIDELLTRADIVDVIDSYIPTKKQGANYVALCPFHNEKTPSFVISPSKQIYHCFGCGVGGNVIGFVMAHERMNFVEAVSLLASRLGLPMPQSDRDSSIEHEQSRNLYDILAKTAKFYEQQLRQHSTSKQAIEYLKKRGLNSEIVKKFHIGYAPPGWDNLVQTFHPDKVLKEQLVKAGLCIQKENGSLYDRFRQRIMFPIHNRHGKIVGFGGRVIRSEDLPKYLNSPETPIFHKGNTLYGLYQVLKLDRTDLQNHSLLVVEGYMDVVALNQYGINYAVATLGTATTERHMKLLFRYNTEVVFCFDGDEAGRTAAKRALETILPILQDGWHPKFMFLPTGEDPDSLVRKEGRESFEHSIEGSESLSEFLFKHLLTQFQLSNAEERAAFGQQALSLIEKVQAPLMKTLLYQSLSKYTRIPVEQLKKSMTKQNLFESEKRLQIKKLQVSPMRMVIASLLQYPDLISILDQSILNFEMPGIDLLREIVALIETSDSKTQILLEHFRNSPHEKILIQLANYEFMIPEETMKLEFAGFLEKLKKDAHDNAVEALLTKANMSGLTDEERLKLQKLLKDHER